MDFRETLGIKNNTGQILCHHSWTAQKHLHRRSRVLFSREFLNGVIKPETSRTSGDTLSPHLICRF